MQRIITEAKVKEMLGRSVSSLYRLRKAGKLKARRLGQRIVYLESDLVEFLSTLPLADPANTDKNTDIKA
jgi:predicted DNA-binding transcriptional regulator AlpA